MVFGHFCCHRPNFKKILVVKNPYWSVLETYLQRYCYSHSISRPHFTFRESVIQDIIEVNYPEDLTQFDDFFITNTNTNLNKIYPNPFNPSLKVEIEVENASEIKLTIFNLNGIQVCAFVK